MCSSALATDARYELPTMGSPRCHHLIEGKRCYERARYRVTLVPKGDAPRGTYAYLCQRHLDSDQFSQRLIENRITNEVVRRPGRYTPVQHEAALDAVTWHHQRTIDIMLVYMHGKTFAERARILGRMTPGEQCLLEGLGLIAWNGGQWRLTECGATYSDVLVRQRFYEKYAQHEQDGVRHPGELEARVTDAGRAV